MSRSVRSLERSSVTKLTEILIDRYLEDRNFGKLSIPMNLGHPVRNGPCLVGCSQM